MEPIDLLPPPNNDNGIKTKDIVIILKKDTTEIDESFNDIVKLGLTKVAELRENKIEALVIKQKYNDIKSDLNSLGQAIDQANKNFRQSVSNTLTELSKKYNLPVTDNFVFVSPYSIYVSPITLLEGLENLTIDDFEAGRNILFTFFNIPDDSEIPLGFYLVRVLKDVRTGGWKAELKDLTGKLILETSAEIKSGVYPSAKELPGRLVGYFNDEFGVRFGYQSSNLSVRTFIKLGTGNLNAYKLLPEGENILSMLTVLRAQVEPALKKASPYTISNHILLSTRDDALFAGALIQDNIQNSDGTRDLCFTYLDIQGIEKGFYYISISKNDNYRKGYLKNVNGSFVKEFDVNVSTGQGKEIGLVGGIIDSEVSIQIISSTIIDGNGLIEMVLKF